MFPIIANSGNFSGYQTQRSLRFRANATSWAYRNITITPADTNPLRKTYSMWVKRGQLSTTQELISNFISTSNFWGLYLSSDDRLCFAAYESGAVQASKISAAQFRDPTAHMHVVLVTDTANAVAEDRVQLYANGARITAWNTNTTPALNAVTAAAFIAPGAGTWFLNIGRLANGSNYLDSYLSYVVCVDGQALAPTAFGQTDATGNWIPKEYTGTYGTNGFHLDFSDPTSTTTLCYDSSGANNLLPLSSNPSGWIPFTESGSTVSVTTVVDGVYGTVTRITKTDSNASSRAGIYSVFSGARGSLFNASTLVKTNVTGTVGTAIYVDAARAGGGLVTSTASVPSSVGVWQKVSCQGNGPLAGSGNYYVLIQGPAGSSVDIFQPRLAMTGTSSEYIETTGTAIPPKDWTANNISLTAGATYDSMLDVPLGGGGNERGNYATLNPLDRASTVSDGNLTTSNGAQTFLGVRSTIALPLSTKTYVELPVGTSSGANNITSFGLATASLNLAASPNAASGFWGIYGGGSGNTPMTRNGVTSSLLANVTITAGDVFQIAYDPATGQGWLGRNNVWWDGSNGTTGNPSLGTNPTFTSLPSSLFVVMCNYASTSYLNAGQRPFAYTPPTGFLPLHTGNLPIPTIIKPNKHFDVTVALGSGLSAAVSALDMTTKDFRWVKNRANGTTGHVLWDVNRGATARLDSSSTAAESTLDYSNLVQAENHVAWVWKAGGAAVTNNAGTIASQVSANVAAGFSIVTYTGIAGSIGRSFGHGLGVAPKLVIVKDRDAASSGTSYWAVWHGSLAANQYLYLNTTESVQTASNRFNGTAPSTTVVSIGGDSSNVYNESGHRYIAYCFAEIPGYSKIDKYTGNGSTDGPFVYCGFRPRYLLVKRVDGVTSWNIYDSSRDPFNAATKPLQTNAPDAEIYSLAIDLTASGFKIRNTNVTHNASGGTYVFLAIAEAPFKYANSR